MLKLGKKHVYDKYFELCSGAIKKHLVPSTVNTPSKDNIIASHLILVVTASD